jgi:hypothetical protein
VQIRFCVDYTYCFCSNFALKNYEILIKNSAEIVCTTQFERGARCMVRSVFCRLQLGTKTFDRSCGRPATAAEPQLQVFYKKFDFQNMSKKNHKVKKNWKK